MDIVTSQRQDTPIMVQQQLFKEQCEQFFSQIHSPLPLLALIDHLPATYFFAKDHLGRFIHVNQALLEVLGLKDEVEVAGKTDHDFFTPELADRFRDQDRQVMSTGEPLIDHVSAMPDAKGVLGWYVETKIPLFDHNQRAIGVAGIMHDVEKAGAKLAPYNRLNEAINHINDHYTEKIAVETLAEAVHLSVSQFNRVFKQLLNITPAQYINRVRINAACSMLRATCESVETISSRTGFCDASHFVRQFKKTMQITPRAYREEWTDSTSSKQLKIEPPRTPRAPRKNAGLKK